MTLVSALIAVAVVTVEALNLIGERVRLHDGLWHLPGDLSEHFGWLGIAIAGLFLGAWAIAVLLYRVAGRDEIEAREAA